MESHWKTNLVDLFQKTNKGSKAFRKILNSHSKIKVDYNLNKWIDKLGTDKLCTSEVLAGYRNMQAKNFPRQLLDFKARLLLGKTQFGKTIAKWSSQNVSQGCKFCLRQGHFAYDDFKHRLIDCPTTKQITRHIREKLTKQKVFTPVHLIFTNQRCIYQLRNIENKNLNPAEEHSHCANLISDKLHKMLSLTFIWDNCIWFIMQCSNNDVIPTKAQTLEYILTQVKNQIHAAPNDPMCIELMNIIKSQTE